MIEKIVLDYLAAQENFPPVYMEIPPNLPSTPFVVLEKTGSSAENHIFRATIAIQSYAPTMYGAATLNETVKELMESLPTLAEVSACDLNSDYNYTDTATKQYRYQAVFDIIHY